MTINTLNILQYYSSVATSEGKKGNLKKKKGCILRWGHTQIL